MTLTSGRAREGLLGSLISSAANEAAGLEPYREQMMAETYELLLKP
jgi:hypothetical protein